MKLVCHQCLASMGSEFWNATNILGPCHHKYGKKAFPVKLCKLLYHSSSEKPQKTVVSFTVGAVHDAAC